MATITAWSVFHTNSQNRQNGNKAIPDLNKQNIKTVETPQKNYGLKANYKSNLYVAMKEKAMLETELDKIRMDAIRRHVARRLSRESDMYIAPAVNEQTRGHTNTEVTSKEKRSDVDKESNLTAKRSPNQRTDMKSDQQCNGMNTKGGSVKVLGEPAAKMASQQTSTRRPVQTEEKIRRDTVRRHIAKSLLRESDAVPAASERTRRPKNVEVASKGNRSHVDKESILPAKRSPNKQTKKSRTDMKLDQQCNEMDSKGGSVNIHVLGEPEANMASQQTSTGKPEQTRITLDIGVAIDKVKWVNNEMLQQETRPVKHTRLATKRHDKSVKKLDKNSKGSVIESKSNEDPGRSECSTPPKQFSAINIVSVADKQNVQQGGRFINVDITELHKALTAQRTGSNSVATNSDGPDINPQDLQTTTNSETAEKAIVHENSSGDRNICDSSVVLSKIIRRKGVTTCDILETVPEIVIVDMSSGYGSNRGGSKSSSRSSTGTGKAEGGGQRKNVNSLADNTTKRDERKSEVKVLTEKDLLTNPEIYNPDGSYRTKFMMKSMDERFDEAQKARYIRSKDPKFTAKERELGVNEIFDKK